jgi:hypothetical protein
MAPNTSAMRFNLDMACIKQGLIARSDSAGNATKQEILNRVIPERSFREARTELSINPRPMEPRFWIPA